MSGLHFIMMIIISVHVSRAKSRDRMMIMHKVARQNKRSNLSLIVSLLISYSMTNPGRRSH